MSNAEKPKETTGLTSPDGVRASAPVLAAVKTPTPPIPERLLTPATNPGQKLSGPIRTPTYSGAHQLLRTPPPPPPLTRLGRYQIVKRIATGGMAEVYLAVHGELSGFRTPVVLKKVLPHLAINQQFIDMFLDEARIASLLDHPNVVRIIEVGRTGTEYFLAMELVQGKPMSSLIRHVQDTGVPLDHRLAAMIVAHAAAGLHHAHELSDVNGTRLNLVHRDVSPQNILISFEGSVKVIDFGIARALGRITDTNTGGMKGKFGYMSPEQAKGEEVDARTDIFALGVVLWESVCGERLFHRDNDLATMRALLYEQIPKPSTVVEIAPDLENIIMRALTRNPKFRYQTARELATALEKFTVQAGGASSAELGTILKQNFAEDLADWQQTVRVALTMPVEPEPLPGPAPGTAMPSENVSATNVISTTYAPQRRGGWLIGAVIGALVVLVGVLLMRGNGNPPVAAPPAPVVAAPAPVVVPPSAPVPPPVVAPPPAPEAPVAVAPEPPPSKPAGKSGHRKKHEKGSSGKRLLSTPVKPVDDRRPNPF